MRSGPPEPRSCRVTAMLRDPSRTPVRYERVADPAALLTLWALGPWAWAAQGAAMMGMLGLSAIALSVPRVGRAEERSAF